MSKPKIRFKGYEEDWEQRKLGDVLEEFSNKSTVEDEYTVLSSTNTGMEFRDGRVSGTSNLGYKIIEIDDLVLSPQNLWLGNININNLEKGLVSPSYKTFKLRNIDKEFFRPQLRTKKMLELYKQASVQGASVVRRNLDMDLFEQIELNIPMIEEQAKIGEYFFNLDYLITLHQRKCEETKKLKKYMLQKMFPQNRKRVPEIRFAGFTDDWEQRKLKNEAEFGKGNGYSKSDLTEFGTPIILYGRLYTKYENLISDVDTFVNTKDGSVYSEGGEVIVPASGETAIDIARAATVEKAGILLGGDLNIIKPNNNIDSKFLSLSISNGNSQRELAKKAQGKSVVHIHNKEIQDLIIPFPCIEEQKNISKYFFKLDRLITLHQRKYEELQKIKKFMLQNMFI